MGAATDYSIERSFTMKALNHIGRSKVKRPHWSVQCMAAEITKHAESEVPERAPLRWVILRVEVTFSRWPEPKIPSESCGYWCRCRRWRHNDRIAKVRAAHRGTIVAAIDLANFANQSGLHRFDRPADTVTRVTLVAQLSDHFVTLFGLHQCPALPDVVSKGFLSVNVNATLSLPLADLPGLPIANCGNAVLAAIPVAAVRNDLRFIMALTDVEALAGDSASSIVYRDF
jgi:hypothetical protein